MLQLSIIVMPIFTPLTAWLYVVHHPNSYVNIINSWVAMVHDSDSYVYNDWATC